MRSINPRLLDPDEVFITETGELYEIDHAAYHFNFDTKDFNLVLIGTSLSDGKYTQLKYSDVTFVTHKHNWPAYAAKRLARA